MLRSSVPPGTLPAPTPPPPPPPAPFCWSFQPFPAGAFLHSWKGRTCASQWLHFKLGLLGRGKQLEIVLSELRHPTPWRSVVLKFSTIGTVHSGSALHWGGRAVTAPGSVWRWHVMVHMVWVGSQKAQPLLILPLFCHLGANREERGELFSCCLPHGS